jgi:hypothetical protein
MKQYNTLATLARGTFATLSFALLTANTPSVFADTTPFGTRIDGGGSSSDKKDGAKSTDASGKPTDARKPAQAAPQAALSAVLAAPGV